MAWKDFSDDSKDCVCAAISVLGGPGKAVLRSQLVVARQLLTAQKATATILINTDSTAQLAVLELSLTLYQGVSAPVDALASFATDMLAPATDCAPLQVFGTAIKVMTDFTDSISETEEEIAQLKLSIDDDRRTVERYDRLIQVMDDLISAVDEC